MPLFKSCFCSSDKNIIAPITISNKSKQRVNMIKDFLEAKYTNKEWETIDSISRQKILDTRMDSLNMKKEQKKATRSQLYRLEYLLATEKNKSYEIIDFDLLCIIGRGSFGEVYLVRHKADGEIYALKVMPKSLPLVKIKAAYLKSEKDVLRLGRHSGWIAKLRFAFQDDENLYLVMDACFGADFMSLLMQRGRLSEAHAQFFMAEAILAIDSIHKLGYIHRDCKPDNFLIDSTGHLVLTDLGLCKQSFSSQNNRQQNVRYKLPIFSKRRDANNSISCLNNNNNNSHIFSPDPCRIAPRRSYYNDNNDTQTSSSNERTNSFVGTPDYCAPEVLLGRYYDVESDFWALGVMLYECVIGYTPFHGETPWQVCKKIRDWRDHFHIKDKYKKNLSSECVDFIEKLIQPASSRLGIHGVWELKSHPWFKEIDWGSLRKQKSPIEFNFPMSIHTIKEELRSIELDSLRLQELLSILTQYFDPEYQVPNPYNRNNIQSNSARDDVSYRDSVPCWEDEDDDFAKNYRWARPSINEVSPSVTPLDHDSSKSSHRKNTKESLRELSSDGVSKGTKHRSLPSRRTIGGGSRQYWKNNIHFLGYEYTNSTALEIQIEDFISMENLLHTQQEYNMKVEDEKNAEIGKVNPISMNTTTTTTNNNINNKSVVVDKDDLMLVTEPGTTGVVNSEQSLITIPVTPTSNSVKGSLSLRHTLNLCVPPSTSFHNKSQVYSPTFESLRLNITSPRA